MDLSTIEREISSLDHEFYGGVEVPAIEAASLAIGLTFPPGYVNFLRELGAGYVSFQEFIGLGGPDHLDVVSQTERLRETSRISRFPPHLIPVLADGYGNFDCIDTSRSRAGGEYEIVSWLHDAGDAQDYEGLANSYLDWFWSVIQMVKEVDSV